MLLQRSSDLHEFEDKRVAHISHISRSGPEFLGRSLRGRVDGEPFQQAAMPKRERGSQRGVARSCKPHPRRVHGVRDSDVLQTARFMEVLPFGQ